MKTTRIKIKNLFGISETELDGRSIELTGANGVGKTSVIDSIRYALTNGSDRKVIIKDGASEGEIYIETDTGLGINRRKRANQADYKSIKEGGKEVMSPESFLKTLFSPLQLDPVAFAAMTEKEKNRAILDLIEFPWDLNYIREQFGEIPSWVDYSQNILSVLHDLQSENGDWFKERQDINRDIRNKNAIISSIAADIPDHYDAEKWENYSLSESYAALSKYKEHNSRIERAKLFKDSYDNKLRGLEADKQIEISAAEQEIQSEKDMLNSRIASLREEIAGYEAKLGGLSGKLEDKKSLAESHYQEKKTKLNADMSVADEYINKPLVDVTQIEAEINIAEEMKRHLNEYKRMTAMREEVQELKNKSDSLTNRIERARELPGEILRTAQLPIEGLTVVDGIPHINGLPISNISEGEQLALCVDVALAKPNGLQIILIDGTEKLSTENREKLYRKCKEKGVQFIATRTTDSSEMEVHYL